MMIATKTRTTVFMLYALAIVTIAPANVLEDNRAWISISAQGKINESGLGWYFEYQPRWRNNIQDRDQLLIRPAIAYKLNSKSSVWFGYGNITNYGATANTTENRLWQQFSTSLSQFSGFSISSRTRLEQRRVDGRSDTGWRLRQQFRAQRPIPNSEFSLILWNEYFHNFNRTDFGQLAGFDQNRLFLGFGYNFNANARIELGYVNQYIRGASNDRQNNVIATTMSYRF